MEPYWTSIQKSPFSIFFKKYEKMRSPLRATFKTPNFQTLCELGKSWKPKTTIQKFQFWIYRWIWKGSNLIGVSLLKMRYFGLSEVVKCSAKKKRKEKKKKFESIRFLSPRVINLDSGCFSQLAPSFFPNMQVLCVEVSGSFMISRFQDPLQNLWYHS